MGLEGRILLPSCFRKITESSQGRMRLWAVQGGVVLGRKEDHGRLREEGQINASTDD